MNRLRIAERLWIVALVPVAALCILSLLAVTDHWSDLRHKESMGPQLRVGGAVSDLVHEFQKERGLSSGYLAGRGSPEQLAPLQAARAASDTAVVRFRQTLAGTGDLDAGMREKIERIDKEMAGLAATRASIDKLELAPSRAVELYTNLIMALFGPLNDLIVDADETGTADLFALRALMTGKEMAGRERATGNALASAKTFEIGAWQAFVAASARQIDQFETYLEFASPEARKAHLAMIAEMAKGDYGRLQRALFDMGRAGAGGTVAPADWWTAATGRIDRLRLAEEALVARIDERQALAAAAAKSTLWGRLGFDIAIVLAALTVTTLMARAISRPVVATAKALDSILAGDHDTPLPAPQAQRSEIGRISNALGQFIAVLRERDRLEAEQLRREREQSDERRQVLMRMAHEVESATDSSMLAIVRGSSTVTTRAEEIRASLDAAHAASVKAAETAQATRELNVHATDLSDDLVQTIEEIAEQVQKGSTLTGRAVDRAQDAGATIQDLAKAAEAIGSIVSVINSIAAQTHLLALNATIEAARAGEAGRGFAIVAQEVKNLAGRTSASTDEITQKIQEIQSTTDRAVDSLSSVSVSIDELSQVTNAIAAAMEEERTAARGFVESVRQTNTAFGDVVTRMSEIREMVNRSASVAYSLTDLASQMQTASEGMRAEVPRIVRDATQAAERRAKDRWPANTAISVEGQAVRLIDVSEEGLRIASDATLTPQSIVTVDLGDGERRSAQVAWVNGRQAGLRLADPMPAILLNSMKTGPARKRAA